MKKSYTGDKAKYSNDDMNACFEKIKGLADAGAFPENMATIEYFDAKQLFNEGKAKQCSEQVSGTVQNLIKISVNTLDSGGDQNLRILLMNRILQ